MHNYNQPDVIRLILFLKITSDAFDGFLKFDNLKRRFNHNVSIN